jgi:hypothetical protein
MYAFQGEKVLEFELGDMKTHGVFRIVAVDNDLVSFIDLPVAGNKIPIPHTDKIDKISFSRNPIVLVTNPKDGRYRIPNKEPYRLIMSSTHIRALIWCDKPIQNVRVFIDNEVLDSNATYHGRGAPWTGIDNLNEQEPYVPLWTIPWYPRKYDDDSVHILNVIATDTIGREGNHTVRFRVDGSMIKDMDSGTGGFIVSLPLGLLVLSLLN